MRNLIRMLLIGCIVGIVIGWRLAQRKQAQAEQAKRDAFENDPEVAEIRSAWRREKRVDRWIEEIEDDHA